MKVLLRKIFPKVPEHEENINIKNIVLASRPEKGQKDERIEIFKGAVPWPKNEILLT